MSGLEELLTGRTLVKRYRIGEVIGRGGFAAVYRAEDDRLGRPVAVKVITYPAPDAETREHLRERFQREARAAASMPQHPNVVTVHDFGTDPELGLDFLVMEFLHGENLATYLDREGHPPLDLALRILRETAEGLCIGHRAGLVHRDVKPGNIFLAQPSPDTPLRVCLLDFGIAHLVEEEGESTRLTKAGFAPHSPAYASPEQLRGAANLTPASDVFSLGVVGYQLLTGDKPFGDAHRRREEEWTPARGVREMNPGIPAAIEEVLRRAMAFEPEERFSDAGEMAGALDRAMGAEEAVYVPVPHPTVAAADDDQTLLQVTPPPPPPPPPPAQIRTSPPRVVERRHRGFPAWLAVLLILALVGAAGVWAMGRRGRGPSAERAGTVPFPDSAMVTGPETSGSAGGSGGGGADEGPAAVPAEETPGVAAAQEGAGEQRRGRGRGRGAGGGNVPPGQAKKQADSFDSTGALLPVPTVPMTPGAEPASTEPAGATPTSPSQTQTQRQRQQPATPEVPATGEPATPAPRRGARDTLITVPSPPPRLLGRPAHPDSARADTVGR